MFLLLTVINPLVQTISQIFPNLLMVNLIGPLLRICTWNCQGMRNKYDELDLFLRTYDIDIQLATETKL